MSWDFFSTTGYVSVGLWLAVPLLWLLHKVWRPRGRIIHIALLLAIGAYVTARINSQTYVNRIQADYSKEMSEAQERQEKARRAAEQAREGEVAEIRFAEDGAGDYLDVGGMDEADRKYIESFDEQATPEWKKKKRKRSGSNAGEDDLDALVHSGEESETGTGMEAETGEEEADLKPILMPEEQKVMANRIDGLNIAMATWIAWIALAFTLLDYLYRVNVYREAYFPLPLPGSLVNGFTHPPAQRTIPERPRRSMVKELKWMIRRGDSFLYLTDRRDAADAVPEIAYRLPFRRWPAEILRVAVDDVLMDDKFIFEALWHNRASFVVDSAARAEELLGHIADSLYERRGTRAVAKQTVHIVWDLSEPVPEELREEVIAFAKTTGFSLVENAAS